jgi:hypothetical protein
VKPVEAKYLPIKGFASFLDDDPRKSILHSFSSSGRAELFDNTPMFALLKYKWDSFASRHFMIEFALYIVFLCLFTLFGSLHGRHGVGYRQSVVSNIGGQ